MSVKTFSAVYRGYGNYTRGSRACPGLAGRCVLAGAGWDNCAVGRGLIAIGAIRCLAGVEPFGKVFYPAVDSKDVCKIGQP
jgi:hypothetical protein